MIILFWENTPVSVFLRNTLGSLAIELNNITSSYITDVLYKRNMLWLYYIGNTQRHVIKKIESPHLVSVYIEPKPTTCHSLDQHFRLLWGIVTNWFWALGIADTFMALSEIPQSLPALSTCCTVIIQQMHVTGRPTE